MTKLNLIVKYLLVSLLELGLLGLLGVNIPISDVVPFNPASYALYHRTYRKW